MKELQEKSAKNLQLSYPRYLQKLLDSDEVLEEDKEKILELKALIASDKYLPTDLIDYRHLFNKYARFSMFKTKSLMHMANFMSIHPVTGVNTINNILKLFKV